MNTLSPNETLIDFSSWSIDHKKSISRSIDDIGMEMLHKPMNKCVSEALARHPHDSLASIGTMDPLPFDWEDKHGINGNDSSQDNLWQFSAYQPPSHALATEQHFERTRETNSYPIECTMSSERGHIETMMECPSANIVPTENMYDAGECHPNYLKQKMAKRAYPSLVSTWPTTDSAFHFSSKSEEHLLLQASEILLGRNVSRQGNMYHGLNKGVGQTSVSDSLKLAQDIVNSMEDYTNPFSSMHDTNCRDYVSVKAEDVLLGRGAKSNSHCGNKRFHKEKAIFSTKYLQASTVAEKTKIAQSLVDAVASYGGRFLAKGHGGWYVVHQRVARTKASQALRDERRRSQGSRKYMNASL